MDPLAKPAPVDDELEKDIEVPDDGSTPPADKEVDLDEEDAAAADFKSLDHKAFYALRKEAAEQKKEREALQKRIDAYEKQPKVAPPVAPVADPTRRREMINGLPVPETKQEWDALARSDWQTAIDMRAIIKAREVAGEVKKADLAARSLDESKNKVLQRHPELADAQTEKGKIYLEILDRNPEYLTMSKGPVLAMRDMEDEMEARGFTREQIFDSKKAAAQTDATRVSRGALTAAGRMPEKSARTVTLSKDEVEFCKSQGIKVEDFAKERLNNENNRKGAQL